MAKEKDYDYSFSPSKLGKMQCPRCFYDENMLGIEQPRGIFPGLPGGVDRVMKDVRDSKREVFPSHLTGKINGKFYGTVAYITKLRNWQSGLKAMLLIKGKRVRVIGALDDLIEESTGAFSPYDDKTKGDLPKDDGAKYYQLQLDLYALLLQENGMQSSGKAYLNYHYPVTMNGDEIVFGHQLYTLTTDPNRAVATMEKAIELLEGKRPLSNSSCGYCQCAVKQIEQFLREMRQPAETT